MQKLEDFGETNKLMKILILNTISLMVSNSEFSENDFKAVTEDYNKELPKIIKDYEDFCHKTGKNPDYLKSVINYDNPTDIIKSIQLGEKEFLKNVQSIPESIRDLYKILFILAKSMCTNILDLESFGIEDGYEKILKLLNFLNLDNQQEAEIKNFIIEMTVTDNVLMKKLNSAKIERYGIPHPKSVSYTTTPAKAVLVVGSNLRELEIILDALKDYDIDVYTHDEMILAHTYPKFGEYAHLKGQFGQGTENCLLDFATFPGPIILTRHSLFNVENLYRGRLYTTDIAYSKGVIPIQQYDFTDVIESALNSKGFKSGKICKNEVVGFNYEETLELIEAKIKENQYSKIIIIGLNEYTKEANAYFETFFDLIKNDSLVISLSSCIDKDNIICLNACFDSYAMLKISEDMLQKYDLPISLIFPKCDLHTISKMIFLSSKKADSIFVGKCTPISINPSLIKTLTNIFKIKKLSTPKKDIQLIYGDRLS